MILKTIQYLGQAMTVACDENCGKAWGMNSRPRVTLSNNEDDYAYLSDGELGNAPDDPETYEGRDAKPLTPDQRMNKWCVRECERCAHTRPGESENIPVLRDFSKRVYNIPRNGGDGK